MINLINVKKKNIKTTPFFERTINLKGIVFLPIRYNNFVPKVEYDLIKKTTSNISFTIGAVIT